MQLPSGKRWRVMKPAGIRCPGSCFEFGKHEACSCRFRTSCIGGCFSRHRAQETRPLPGRPQSCRGISSQSRREQDASILRGAGPAGRETIPPAQEHRPLERPGLPCQGFAGLQHPVPAHGFKIAGLLWVTSSYQVQFRCLNWPAHPSRCPHKTARPDPRQARLSCDPTFRLRTAVRN